MGTDHPPRDKQAHVTVALVAEPASLSRYLRMPFERMNLHLGAANTPKTFTRCLRRMPGFAGVQLSDLIRKTSFTQDNAVSWQNRSQGWRAHAPCPRGRTHLH